MKALIKRTHFVFFVSLFFSTSLLAESCLPHSIYLVRHAEKQKIEGERDPELTQLGSKRAQSLSQLLKDSTLTRIFSSQFKRTQQTVEPTAKSKNLKVLVRDAIAVKELANELLASCNESILVAGHSNTIPQLLKALGLTFKVSVGGESLRFEPVIYLNDKDDYGSLFKVTFADNGKPQLELSTF